MRLSETCRQLTDAARDPTGGSRRTPGDHISWCSEQSSENSKKFIISPNLPALNGYSITKISKMTRLQKLAFGVGDQIEISSDLAKLKDLRSLKILGLGIGQEDIMPGKLEYLKT